MFISHTHEFENECVCEYSRIAFKAMMCLMCDWFGCLKQVVFDIPVLIKMWEYILNIGCKEKKFVGVFTENLHETKLVH